MVVQADQVMALRRFAEGAFEQFELTVGKKTGHRAGDR